MRDVREETNPVMAMEPGDIVRVTAAGGSWWFAAVTELKPQILERLWDPRELVRRQRYRVTTLQEWLGGRKHSVKRESLCQAYFGTEMRRLPQPRLLQLQRFLRKNGIAFAPDEWSSPDQRVQLWLDSSVVDRNASARDAKLTTLLPRWLEPLHLPPGSRDPLGFQATAEQSANSLLPGLTVYTNRIGYYGFLLWAIQTVNEHDSVAGGQTRRELLNRLERAFALCEFVYHGAQRKSCPIIGSRSRTQVLASAIGDRFKVPGRILRNQNAAGAYRLYATSLVSLGFVTESQDNAVEGLLPFELTDAGRELANLFARQFDERIDERKFKEFAWSDRTEHRRTLHEWGSRLCFSQIVPRSKRYRSVFLQGLLLGNSRDAERRYETVKRLLGRELLTGTYVAKDYEESTTDQVAEEDAGGLDEVAIRSDLSNLGVLAAFYNETPSDENRDFQTAAVLEFTAVGLSAVFNALVVELRERGCATPSALADRIAAVKRWGALWSTPIQTAMDQRHKVAVLVRKTLAEEKPTTKATLGGCLLMRLLGDVPLAAVAEDVKDSPAFALLKDTVTDNVSKSLKEVLPDLISALVDRHEQVSQDKNRQRWCYLDRGQVRKDDLRNFAVGIHSFRFPQLYSLCFDLKLQSEDLVDG